MYRFEFCLTEEDYLAFNKFHMFSSQQQGKQIQTLRYIMSSMGVVLWIISIISVDVSRADIIFNGIVYLSLSALFFFGTKPVMWAMTKSMLKKKLQKGERLYSPEAVLEFSDEFFVETTKVNRTECSYEMIEYICLVNGSVFYLYLNSMQAYILPVRAFESATQYNGFVDFIQKKTNRTINIVNEKR